MTTKKVTLVGPYYEWRYAIGTKTEPAHAYTKIKYGGDGDTRPLCNVGSGQRWTKPLESASKKRLYPIGLCSRCVELLHEQGEVYIHKSQEGAK